MKRIQFLLLFLSANSLSQSPEKDLLSVNTQIDQAVIMKDTALLKKLYADDFIFSHGTGLVEGKGSWLKTVQRPNLQYLSRTHDSTTVEMHGKVAIVAGRLIVVRVAQDTLKYGLWYVRVFENRKKQWQLISHRTTKEWHY